MTEPHESWASIYDIAYEQSFGEFYKDLTDTTIDVITNVVIPPARIVDFGAGTGRLSIPLSARGYKIMAVEPCKEMLDQLTSKSGQLSISTFHGKMQDFQTDTPFDIALCVFTVLLYLLDEESLKKSIQAAANALKHDGLMLIDIPLKAVFQSYHTNTPTIQRDVSIQPSQDHDIYLYTDRITMKMEEQNTTYRDSFCIRHWKMDDVMKILSDSGFVVIRNMSEEFTGAGSNYLLVRKST